MTMTSLTTLEDGAYRVARIGLRVLRKDRDPDNLPRDVYDRLRKSIALLDPDALGRADAAVLAIPEGELLDVLESNLENDGQKVNTSNAAGMLAARPDVIDAVIGCDVNSVPEEAKLGALSLGLGVAYLAVEQYLELVMLAWRGEEERGAGDTLI